MPPLKVGDRVQVDISGLKAPGVSVGTGVLASGTIERVDPVRREYTVRLDVSFSGKSTLKVPF
jgi:hypothetical protein